MEDQERGQERPVRRAPQNAQEGENASVQGSIEEGRKVITEIERLFRESSQVPLMKTRMVREEDYKDLMGQLRIVMPKMVREAGSVLDQRDEMIAEASDAAKRLREEADRYDRQHREEADAFEKQTRMDAETYRREVMGRAQDEANAIVEDAQTRAAQIIEAAQQQAKGLIEENEITRRAQAYALEIQDSAQQHANAIYQQACHQTDLMLSGAAAALSRSAGEMAQLRDSLLKGGQAEGAENKERA